MLVAQVEFTEWTPDGHLRHSKCVGLRENIKEAREVMGNIKVSIVSLGNLKYPVDFKFLEGWRSDVMTIIHGGSVGHLPNAEGDDWQYTDEQLYKIVKPDREAAFTLGLINAPLNRNFYHIRISNDVAVLSLYEMADIVRYSEFTIENFILRSTYELLVLYAAYGKLIPSDNEIWSHDEVRGCLFDMNANKSDIVFSLHRPILCPSCKNRLLSKQVQATFLPALEQELPRIQKNLYIRILHWVNRTSALRITCHSTLRARSQFCCECPI